MKPKWTTLLAAALLLAASPAAAQARVRLLKDAMDVIARQDKGHVWGPWAEYVRADLDGDGVADRLTLFTIEDIGGGHNWWYYLSVQLSSARWRPITESIGGKLSRQPVTLRVEGGTIVVPMREWTEEDSGCCPTRPAVARFRLRGGRIVEIDG